MIRFHFSFFPLFILFFSLLSYRGNAQFSVDIIPEWRVEKPLVYQLQSSVSKVIDGDTTSTKLEFEELKIYFLKSGKKYTTLNWASTRMRYDAEKDDYFPISFHPIKTYEVDALGVYQKLVNWKDLRKKVNDYIQKMDASSGVKGSKKITKKIKSKEYIQVLMEKEIKIFHAMMGIRIVEGEPLVGQVYIPSPGIQVPILMNYNIKIANVDPIEGTCELQSISMPEGGLNEDFISDVFKDLGINKEEIKEFKEGDQDLQLQSISFASYTFDYVNRVFTDISYKRVVEFQGDQNVYHLRVKLKP